jgi:outer membrane protein TolC
MRQWIAGPFIAVLLGSQMVLAENDGVDFSSLTIRDAVGLALQNNLGARVERLQGDIAGAHITERLAEFDPAFTFSGSYESKVTPQDTQEFVATRTLATQESGNRIFWEDNWRYESGLKGKLPFGTEYELGVNLNELRNSLNIQIPPSLFYPEYQSFAGVRITQPLLKDFGFDAQLAGLRVARSDSRLAALSWRLKVEQLVAGVMKNYYDLVFATQDTKIKSENIARARQLEDQNRKRVEKGVGSEIDVQQATVAASVREEELIAAEYVAREKSDLLLRDLVADLDVAAVPRVRTVHALSSVVPPMRRVDLMREAISNRTEFKQAQEQLAKQDIKIKFAENQTWPRLDLFGTLGANGLRPTAGSALEHAFDQATPAWSLGVMVTIPLGNRQAKAQLHEARTEKEQLILNYKQLEVDLTLQVDTAVARVETSEKRLATARKSVQAASTTLDAELKRLEQGVGISFNILEAQKDLAAASTREMAARADLNKSLVDLWLATGTLLQKQNIKLDPSSPTGAGTPVKPAKAK